MDSLILALEEHKSKSKPRAVTGITRIIQLRERSARGAWREREEVGRYRIQSHCFSFSQTNLHTHHLFPCVEPWVIYKCLVMRLFLQFNTSIHQALGRGGLIRSTLSFLSFFFLEEERLYRNNCHQKRATFKVFQPTIQEFYRNTNLINPPYLILTQNHQLIQINLYD